MDVTIRSSNYVVKDNVAVISDRDSEALRETARRAPADVHARTAYAAALAGAQRFGEARDELLDALARCGDSPALLWRLAAMQAALGLGTEAHGTLQRALSAGPLSADDVHRIGVLLL